MKNWIAYFVYASEDGRASTETRTISANSRKDAFTLASKNPPSAEFILQILPESDDQFLNKVRQDATKLSGQAKPYDARDFPGIENEPDPEAVLDQLMQDLQKLRDHEN